VGFGRRGAAVSARLLAARAAYAAKREEIRSLLSQGSAARPPLPGCDLYEQLDASPEAAEYGAAVAAANQRIDLSEVDS
jgi:hypothetical protein